MQFDMFGGVFYHAENGRVTNWSLGSVWLHGADMKSIPLTEMLHTFCSIRMAK